MPHFLSVFPSEVYGIPCDIGVVDYEEYVPPVVSNYVETSYPPEGGTGEWVVLNKKTGKRMPWLENTINADEEQKIADQVLAHMEFGVTNF